MLDLLGEGYDLGIRIARLRDSSVVAATFWQFEPRKLAGKVRSTVVRSRIVVNNGPFRCDAVCGRDA